MIHPDSPGFARLSSGAGCSVALRGFACVGHLCLANGSWNDGSWHAGHFSPLYQTKEFPSPDGKHGEMQE